MTDIIQTEDGFIFTGTNFRGFDKTHSFEVIKSRGHSISLHNSYRKSPFRGYWNSWIETSTQIEPTTVYGDSSYMEHVIWSEIVKYKYFTRNRRNLKEVTIPGDIVVYGHGGLLQTNLQPLLQVVRLFTRLYRGVEKLKHTIKFDLTLPLINKISAKLLHVVLLPQSIINRIY